LDNKRVAICEWLGKEDRMMHLRCKRTDGTFVGTANGLDFHIIPDDPDASSGLWDWASAEAVRLGDDLPFEPAPPALTPEQVQAAYTAAIEAHVEATARARGYTSAVSCATYAVSTIPAWKAEGVAFVAWRDGVWTAALASLAAVKNGGPIPDNPLTGLPQIQWPVLP
jgi:hypothetical protein